MSQIVTVLSSVFELHGRILLRKKLMYYEHVLIKTLPNHVPELDITNLISMYLSVGKCITLF